MINILVLKDKAGNIVYSQSYNSDDDCVEFILPLQFITESDIETLECLVEGDLDIDIKSGEISGLCTISNLQNFENLTAFELSYEFDKEGKLVEIS